MKLSKFLTLAFVLTLFSLLYVWQQTEVFRLAYDGQKNQAAFQDLLDTNSILRYNLKKNTSLVRLGNKVSTSGEFELPANYCLVRLSAPRERTRLARPNAVKKPSLLASIFEVRRQAEAKTLTSSH